MPQERNNTPPHARLRAVLMGASDFPQAPTLQDKDNAVAFVNTNNRWFAYLHRHLELPRSSILDLFDSKDEIAAQTARIREFLDSSIHADNNTDDVFVVYVGHGIVLNDIYHLAVRTTSSQDVGASAWNALAMAKTIMEAAPTRRKYLVIDACFSGGIINAFSALPGTDGGCALLCAGHSHEAVTIAKTARETLFSNNLLHFLEAGVLGGPQNLSFNDLHAALRGLAPAGKTPHAYDVNQNVGTLQHRAFPNFAAGGGQTGPLAALAKEVRDLGRFVYSHFEKPVTFTGDSPPPSCTKLGCVALSHIDEWFRERHRVAEARLRSDYLAEFPECHRFLVSSTLSIFSKLLHGWYGNEPLFELSVFVNPVQPRMAAFWDSNGRDESKSWRLRRENPNYYKDRKYKVVDMFTGKINRDLLIIPDTHKDDTYEFPGDTHRAELRSTVLYMPDRRNEIAIVVTSSVANTFREDNQMTKDAIRALGKAVVADFELCTTDMKRQILT